MCLSDSGVEDGSGLVEECLKVAFNNHRIMDPGCKLEIAGLIEEAKADIHVDPLLHQACGMDVSKFCRDIPQGAGRRKYYFKLRLTCKTSKWTVIYTFFPENSIQNVLAP
jgi:Golgi apparatus protein 1